MRPRWSDRIEWATSGTFAAALALALAWAVSRVVDAVPFAPLSLADRLIRLVPGDAATLAIDRLGKGASLSLAIAITLAFVAAGALLAALTAAGGRPRPALAGIAFAAALLGASLAAPLPAPTAPAVAAAAIGGLLYAGALRSLPLPAAGHDPQRRRALTRIGSSALAVALGGALLARLLRTAGPDTSVAIELPPTPAPTSGPFPRVPGLAAEITSAADHYVVDINLDKPAIEADDWSLRVGGLVRAPLRLSFDELQRRFEIVEQVSVLTCISNPVGGPLVGNSAWSGVRLGDVLRSAGVREQAVDVVFRAADGYDVSVPVARAMAPTALLAIAQNGRPLTQEHGFPCRVRLPALYGMMNAKWVESIELVARDHRGYWAQRGWSAVGEVRTQSRIDAPARARVGEPTWIAGVAWGGERGIARVEVSLDAGRSWQPARLRAPLSPAAWTQWALGWTPQRAGSVALMCRATDRRGRRQTASPSSPHPDGATGYHRTQISVAA